MADINKLLKHRKALKAKKPNFIRQDTHKKKRLIIKWRKPKGLQSKMRLSRAGYRKSVRLGYKSPVLVRGMDRNGMKPILVSNMRELEKINKDTESVIIKKNVGLRNKIELLKKAKDMALTISNMKDVPAFLAKIEKQLKARKENKQRLLKEQKEKEKQRIEKKKEKDKKEAEKDNKKEETADELAEKVKKEEKEQKKEKDKLLTKKE
tara:strand:- start:12941 stop:13564 length:624 start_codon:yes stop_codon:yes gene_type:complete